MVATKQTNAMVKEIIEIGVILQSKYKDLINDIDDYTIDKQYDLCLEVYEHWNNVLDDELVNSDSKGYITEFMNNETHIVNDIIMLFIISSK